MKILLIEDNSFKAEEISSFINQLEIPITILVQASYQAGLRAVEEDNPDLVLLDMTLPTFDRESKGREGRIRPLGGYDLMRKLKRKGLNFPTIVVTQLETFGEGDDKITYEEMIVKCEKEFGPNFLGGVQFLQGSDSWKESLVSLISLLT